MAKIETKISVSMEETFDDFLLMKKSMGLSDKTLITYKQHLSAIKKHLPIEKPIEELERHDLEIMISSMRDIGLSANSIQSYTRTLKTFFTWCNEEGITNLNLSRYRAQETIKDTYTDRELELLLKKPNMRQCKFSEYRNWVIINLLLNNGCRASSIRNIKNKDVDLTNQVIYLRHTKNKKSQVIPLCSMLCAILSEYMRIRGGSDDDYLFSNDMGEQMTEYCLKNTIAKYNRRRGVQKTSIHLFRHTFAKKYLVDCGGNAFTLQRLLGHSTLDMTKHYCAIFDADITKNYDKFSPLNNFKTSRERIKMNKR